MRRLPWGRPRAAALSWWISRARASSSWIRPWTVSPMSVRAKWERLRSIRGTPSSDSRLAMAWLTPDWVMPRRRAAAVKLPRSTTARKISNWVRVMGLARALGLA